MRCRGGAAALLLLAGGAAALRGGLTPNCFGFPARAFGPHNYVDDDWLPNPAGSHDETGCGVKEGTEAVDFTLLDADGAAHSLSGILANGPALIMAGSFTCPIYQRYINDSNALAAQYGGKVQFVIVYVVEPHPLKPDCSPYSGDVWEFAYSEHRQPTNYSTRLALAKQARDNVPSQLLLVDALAGGPYNTSFNNPFWCTYGPNPNGMWAIAANGTVTKALSWFNTVDAEAAIRGLAGLPPAPPSPCTTALSQHCNHGVSHASCKECVVKHTRALKKAGCNATDEAAFCDQD